MCRKRLCFVLNHQPVPTDKGFPASFPSSALVGEASPSLLPFSRSCRAASCPKSDEGLRPPSEVLILHPERIHRAGAFSSLLLNLPLTQSHHGISFFNPFFLLLDSF